MSIQILKLKEVKAKTKMSGSTIYNMVNAGTFPEQIKLNIRSSGWLLSEVEEWLEGRIKASRELAS